MADNVAITAGAGTSIATDEIQVSGTGTLGHVQFVKLVDGTLNGTGAIGGDAANGLDVDVTRFPNGVLDSFAKVQTAQAINDIDVQFWRDVPANLVTITATGGTANNTTVPGAMQMATGTGTTNEIKAVTFDNVLYRAGGEIFCLVTAAWIDGGVAGCNQRIGLYDTNNGFFIGYEATSFGIVVRSGASDAAQVAKASFNVDTLVGGTGSKFTSGGSPVAIDLAKLNVFRIRFGWLGAAPIRFEVLSPDGDWVLFHKILQPNSSAAPSIQSTDLPVTAHLVKTSGASTVRMNTACWGAGVTYGHVDIVGSNTLAAAANSVVNYQTQGVGTMQIRVGTTPGSGTIIFEATVNGTTWITHPSCWLLAAAGSPNTPVTAAVTATSGDTYRFSCIGFRGFRVRVATLLGSTCVLHVTGEAGISIVEVSSGYISGSVAHDAVDSGNPVKVGHVTIAHGTNPTQVAAADRSNWYSNRHGIPFTLGGHPNIVSAEYYSTSVTTDDNVLPAISAGTKYVITCVSVMASAANTVNTSVRLCMGTAIVAQGANQADATTNVILSHPGIAPGSGIVKGNGAGIIGISGDGAELRIANSVPTGGSITVQVDYFTIES